MSLSERLLQRHLLSLRPGCGEGGLVEVRADGRDALLVLGTLGGCPGGPVLRLSCAEQLRGLGQLLLVKLHIRETDEVDRDAYVRPEHM